MMGIDGARRLLLISNSTLHSSGYLDHAEVEIRTFLGHAARVVFVPFAVAGKKPGRESDEETIIFDSTGMALQDVATAVLVYEKAVRQGVGYRLDFAA